MGIAAMMLRVVDVPNVVAVGRLSNQPLQLTGRRLRIEPPGRMPSLLGCVVGTAIGGGLQLSVTREAA